MQEWIVRERKPSDIVWWNSVTFPESGDALVYNVLGDMTNIAMLPRDVATDIVQYAVARPDEYIVTEQR